MFCLKPSHLLRIWRRKLTRFVEIEGICTWCWTFMSILYIFGEWALDKTATTCDISQFFYLLYQEFLIEFSLNKRPLDEGDQAIGLVFLFHLLVLIYMYLSLSPPSTGVWILLTVKEGQWTGGCATRKMLPQKPRPVPSSVPASVSCLSGEHGATAHR